MATQVYNFKSYESMLINQLYDCKTHDEYHQYLNDPEMEFNPKTLFTKEVKIEVGKEKFYTVFARYIGCTPKTEASSIQPVIKRSEIVPPPFLTPVTDLKLSLGLDETEVISKMQVKRNEGNAPLELDIDEIEVNQVLVDGQEVDFLLNQEKTKLIIQAPDSDTFEVRTHCKIHPEKNKALMGLYTSGERLITQNEADGFRRITPSIDRPDNPTVFRITLKGVKRDFPYMLSNGNVVQKKDYLEEQPPLREITYQMPDKMPTYLFAVAAGHFAVLKDTYTYPDGTKVEIRVYCKEGEPPLAKSAANAFKTTLDFAYEKMGLVYPYKKHRMVAVPEFNMGAMENTGLNVFKDTCILCSPTDTPDSRLVYPDQVTRHETLHTWAGNTVMIKDWFQLSLKEGLTTALEHLCIEDKAPSPSTELERHLYFIRNVFPIESGPDAHAVLPDEISSFENLYDSISYEKGAKIITLIKHHLGDDRFYEGMRFYFTELKGQNMDLMDLYDAIGYGAQEDLEPFKIWAKQAGNPIVKVEMDYDEKTKQVTLKCTQSCKPTADKPEEVKKPYPIHMPVALFGKDGRILEVRDLFMDGKAHTFTFDNIPEKPILSLNRGFVSPIKVDYPQTKDELFLIASVETDSFNRYLAMQELLAMQMETLMEGGEVDPRLCDAYLSIFNSVDISGDVKVRMLELPKLTDFAQRHERIDVDKFIKATSKLKEKLYEVINPYLRLQYEAHRDQEILVADKSSPEAVALRNVMAFCLGWMGERVILWQPYIEDAYIHAEAFSIELACLKAMCRYDLKDPVTQKMLHDFFDRHKGNDRALPYYFYLQTTGNNGVLSNIALYKTHPGFDEKNPSFVRYGYFNLAQNLEVFHKLDGDAYRIYCDLVLEVAQDNPSIAVDGMRGFSLLPKLDEARRTRLKQEIGRLLYKCQHMEKKPVALIEKLTNLLRIDGKL